MCSSLEKVICYRSTIITTAQFTDSVRGRVKSTRPSLEYDNPSEARDVWQYQMERIMLGAVITTSLIPEVVIKHRWPGGPWWPVGVQGSGGTTGLVSAATAQASAGSSREVCPSTRLYSSYPRTRFHLSTAHDKIYIYMLNAFLCKENSLHISLWRHVFAVLIRAVLHQFCMYQRCSPLFCLLKMVTNIITLPK